MIIVGVQWALCVRERTSFGDTGKESKVGFQRGPWESTLKTKTE